MWNYKRPIDSCRKTSKEVERIVKMTKP